MSEFVERSIQDMLPELNAMKKSKLFTDDEVNKILQKRKAHEYKIRRKTKEIKTYLNYIEYEEAVLMLLKKRRKMKKFTLMVKDIDVGILKRIHLLYQLAQRRFQGCVELWVKHIEFCIKRNEKARIATLFSKALTFSPHNEGLWVMAAKYEIEHNHSMSGARNVLQKALRANRRSKHLYREYFRMELLNAEKTKMRDEFLSSGASGEQQGSSLTKGVVAEVVLKNALAEFPGDVDFCLSFVGIVRLFPFACWIEDKIYEHLSEDATFKTDDKAKAALACRNLMQTVVDLKAKKQSGSVEVALKRSYLTFKDVVTANKSELIWEMYLELLVNAMKTPEIPKEVLKELSDHILLVCLESIEENMITEPIAITLVGCLKDYGNTDLAIKVTPMLASKFPMNVDIWKSVFASVTSSDDCDAKVILDLLEECNNCLTKSSELVDIWNAVVNWFMEKEQEQMGEIFEISIGTSNRELTVAMKEAYLRWAINSQPLKFVRKLFKRLSKDRPYSSQLVKIYLVAELKQDEVDASLVRKTFDRSLIDFGSSDIDMWMEYIKFEFKNPSKAEDVYARAIRNLNPGLESQFIERYTLFKCGHV